MEGRNTGLGGDPGDVRALHAAAGHQVDTPRRLPVQLCQKRRAEGGVGRLPRGQDRPAAKGNGVLQRPERVVRHVERAVERDLHLPCAGHHAAHLRKVQLAVRRERADDDAVRAEVAEGRDLLAHLLQLRLGIEKIAEARADEHINGHAAAALHLPEQGMRRCRAADDQMGAQLQPVRTGAACRHGRGIGIHTCLDQGSFHFASSFFSFK